MNREPIEIRFVLDAPHTDYQSDINTLILRIDKLVKFYNNIYKDIQEILEHFKFRTKEC